MTTPPPPTRILAATDLRPESDEALQQALSISGGRHRVAICHVLPRVDAIRPLFPQLHIEEGLAAAELEAFAREELDRCLARVGSPDVDVFMEHGAPSVCIVERAKAWRADLIVVGTPRSTSRTSRTAESVVRTATAPVLMARPSGRGPVVAACDLGDASQPALAMAAAQARALGKGLVALHAIDATRELAWLGALSRFSELARDSYENKLASRMEEAKTLLQSAVAAVAPDGLVDVQLGGAAEVICRRAGDLDASLVVVATRGRTGFDYALVGSVAEGVFERAPCSVLAVRDQA